MSKIRFCRPNARWSHFFAACTVLFAARNCGAQIIWYVPNTNYTIARNWSERALESIRMDTPHPPAQARNLFSYSVCMYDAWAAYDSNAVGFIYRGKHTAPDVAAARREAISYAMYRMMAERLAYSRTATNQAIRNPDFMTALGYDPTISTRDTSLPAGVGNSVYDAVSAWFVNDGSRETNGTAYPLANPPVAYPDYPVGDPRRYTFVNPPMNPFLHGTTDGTNAIVDVNKWQRLIVANSIDQNGFPQNPLQGYAGGPWLWVRSFALSRIDSDTPWIDPGPPPFLGAATDAEFKSNLVAVIRASSQLTTDDGVMIDISPATIGNNTLGANDGHGYTTNPVTGLAYSSNIVLRGDFTRALTEFWADGPSSETPPGHWNVIANHVSDDTPLRRIGGTGPEVDRLEWEVKLYFALNGALHDAACAAWSVKRYYNGWRPISGIRYCGGLGQSSDPGLPSYNTNGLPLVPDLIELVTDDSVASGRHAGLTPGKIAVFCWPGQPEFPDTDTSGVHWIHAEDFMPYQKKTFVTPAFPGYISGHSTFSRAAAEVMTAFTGSKWFPNGLGSYTITRLIDEAGPTQPVTLQWASYYDAADQVGLSRIWGGIHPPVDDFTGRRVGAQVGQTAWALARKFFEGSVINSEVLVTARKLDDTNLELRFNAVRGLYYKVLTSTSATGPYSDGGSASQVALEASVASTNALAGAQKFFRVSASLKP
ncbi:MAG TPA: vanadium-dependent haloperoxidase [Candidatus Limnocylindrales bacterium]|nr:vanadium-dependent haloperoxidase [Candidatus Limnocylindrales bacterium]